jgi:lambda family phage portal protein
MIKLSDDLHIPTMREIMSTPVKRQPKKELKRLYSAAKVNRMNSDWTTSSYSRNYSVRQDGRIIRARARDMSANHPHFIKFLKMVRSNVIGAKGLQTQVRARKARGKLDTELNKQISEIFWNWGMKETCTVTQKLNWVGCQRLFATILARDGEVLVQMVNPKENPFGFALKFWNVDYLDETYNEELPDGRRVIMSVEVDANDRPIAYWLTTPASDINYTRRRVRSRIRIPAEQMIHSYLIEDEEAAVRGVSWFAGVLLEGKNHYGYKEGVITSARFASNSLGFLESDVADETQFVGEEDEEGNQADVEIDVAPLSMNELPPGVKLTQFDPKQPTQNHAEFVKTIVRDIAAGLGVNYFSLAGDMGDVNYSSARVGLGEERELWRELQYFVADNFCRPVYHNWCRSAMLAGQLPIDARQYQEIQNPIFRARGWRYVDPQKEVGANVTALENNLATWTDVLADQGIDITEFLETRKSEMELAQTYGIELKIAPKTAPAETKSKDDDDEETDEKPKKKGDRGYTNGHAHVLPN